MGVYVRVLACMCVCHNIYVEVRGQLAEASSLLPASWAHGSNSRQQAFGQVSAH